MVKVGLKLFHELGERTGKMEEEVQVYREVLAKLAAREGGEVPAFFGGEGREFDAKQVRAWLEGVLAGPLGTEQAGGSGARGRGGGARGRGGGGSRSKRPRGTEDGENIEGRRPHSG